MRTQIVLEDGPLDMPPQSIYIATVLINRETDDYRVQSATVTGVQPHPLVAKDNPELFHNSYLVTRDFQKEQGVEGYPLGNWALIQNQAM